MLNTRIKCTYVWTAFDTRKFIKGEIYKVENGRLIFPDKSKSEKTFENIDDINQSFYAAFEEVKN